MSIKTWLLLVILGITEAAFCQSSQQDSSIFFQLKPEELNTVIVLGASNSKKSNAVQNYSAGANLDKILEDNSNIQLVKRGGYAFEPIINGLSGGQTAITIDGMRIFGACTDKMDPVTSYVSANNLSSVNVNAGTSAAEHGSNLNASLNLTSSKAEFSDSLKVKGQVDLGSASAAREYNTGVRLNIGTNHWALKATGNKRKANAYRAGTGQVIPFTQYQKENLSGNFRLKAGKKSIIEAKYIYDKAFDIGYAALPMDVALAESNIAQLSANFYDLLPWISTSTVSVYANRIEHIMDDTKRPPESIAMHMDMPGETNTQGGFGSITIAPSNKDEIILKVDYYNTYQFAEMLMYPENEAVMYMVTWPGVHRKAIGFYAGHVRNFEQNWKLNTSFRIENSLTYLSDSVGIQQLQVFNLNGYTSHNHQPISIQSDLEKTWGKQWVLSLGGGYSQRLPTTSEMYGYYLFNQSDGYDYIGDPDIAMETAYNAVSSLKYTSDKNVLSTRINFQFIDNYIYGVIDPNLWQMTIGANGAKKYSNLKSAQLLNFQTSWKKSWSEHFSSLAEGRYTWGEKNSKVPLPQISPFSYRANIEYSKKNWFGLVEVVGALQQELIDTEFIEFASPAWAIVNLRVKKNIELKKQHLLSIQMGIENLLDSDYHRHLDWGKIARPGINLYGSLSYEF